MFVLFVFCWFSGRRKYRILFPLSSALAPIYSITRHRQKVHTSSKNVYQVLTDITLDIPGLMTPVKSRLIPFGIPGLMTAEGATSWLTEVQMKRGSTDPRKPVSIHLDRGWAQKPFGQRFLASIWCQLCTVLVHIFDSGTRFSVGKRVTERRSFRHPWFASLGHEHPSNLMDVRFNEL